MIIIKDFVQIMAEGVLKRGLKKETNGYMDFISEFSHVQEAAWEKVVKWTSG